MPHLPLRFRTFRSRALLWPAAAGALVLGLTFTGNAVLEHRHHRQVRYRAEQALHRQEQVVKERLKALEASLLLLHARPSRPKGTSSGSPQPLLGHETMGHLQAGWVRTTPDGRATFTPEPLSAGPEPTWVPAGWPLPESMRGSLTHAEGTARPLATPPFQRASDQPPLILFLHALRPGEWAALLVPVADLLARSPGDRDTDFALRLRDVAHPPATPSHDAPLTRVAFPAADRVWILEARLSSRTEAGTLPLTLLGFLLSLFAALGTGLFLAARTRYRLRSRRRARATQWALLRFQHLIRESPLAIIEWNAAGRILGWNPAAEGMFGHSTAQIEGRDGLSLLFPGGCSEGFRHGFQEAQAGRVSPTALASATRRNGEPVLGEWSHVPARDGAGRVRGVTSLVLDVTRKHEADQHLQQHQRLESLGVLAGGIAHDFNNILGIMTGYLEQASHQLASDPGSAEATLAKVDQALQRASGLARQMLAYAGKVPARIEAVDLNRTVTGVVDLLRASLPKLHRLEVTLAEDLPPVSMDSAQLQQVVINLASNAAEALGAHHGRIRIRTRRSELAPADLRRLPPALPMGAGPVVVLEVEDDGCGMDRATLDHIFDPFFTTKFSGRGLGLSVILGMLRTHGASLRVKSAVGHGSRFEVLLPLHTGPVPLEAPEMERPKPPLTATVLFADDEPMLRDLAEQALLADGHRPLLAEDGEAALRLFEQHRSEIALVVLDVTMPRIGGIEVCRQIRLQAPELPVLLSSGYSDQVVPEGTGLAFLPKPYRITHLRTKLAEMLAESAARVDVG